MQSIYALVAVDSNTISASCKSHTMKRIQELNERCSWAVKTCNFNAVEVKTVWVTNPKHSILRKRNTACVSSVWTETSSLSFICADVITWPIAFKSTAEHVDVLRWPDNLSLWVSCGQLSFISKDRPSGGSWSWSISVALLFRYRLQWEGNYQLLPLY